MARDQRANERVYNGLKASILSGELRLRQRLDIETLAGRLGVSATPVRQALAVLAAERLVSVHASRTYHVAFWSEAELRHLYEWRGALARIATETYAPSSFVQQTEQRRDYVSTYAQAMAHLQTGANPEVQRAAAASDERLQAALRAEAEIIPEATKELRTIIGLLRQGGAPLRTALRRFYRRRADASARIRALAHAAAAPRNGD